MDVGRRDGIVACACRDLLARDRKNFNVQVTKPIHREGAIGRSVTLTASIRGCENIVVRAEKCRVDYDEIQ